MDKKYYKEQEVAELLSVSRTTVQHWRVKGVGPKFIKFYGKIRYPHNALNDYLNNHPVYKSTSEYGFVKERQ